MRNPLTQVTGPEFLALFAILIVAVAIICWHRRRSRDSSMELSPLVLPSIFDPYEIAYLRAGENELARVLIVGLMERKYLQITTPESKWWNLFPQGKRIEQAPDHPDLAELSAIERETFDWFDYPRTPEQVFQGARAGMIDLPSTFSSHTLKYEHNLRAQRLLTSEELREEARWIVSLGIAVVAIIGLARLFIGISRGRPVGFLILMGIVGAFAIAKAGRPGRVSLRGLAYLNSMKATWGWLKDPEHGQDWSPSLAAGVFGVAVLAGTEMSPVTEMFKRSSRSYYPGGDSSGGCGAGGGGCGGGGDGGGGCGGGCGGCGGS
jgi:uncharacterized protein (TIGR04222 family)